MKISTVWTNANPNTIENRLAQKLGRAPTPDEIKQELNRIIASVKR